ncbi:DUF4166 domain-containing protein [Lysobacter sp. TY2-98]|uniref:DUF4166 domain-containing protein n=1 Tax=Lysobacter sp. TY2-98 TaxID=2290922 RepID=UPI000E209541|nr:DUF4166 domain-containing protein [Lysobacter sp. TY2-98]AXK71001.1 DUF4166 domain-containing protein [Lysobacter sp. TY2-98]
MDHSLIPDTLFGRLLGEAYVRLPATVAALHARDGAQRYTGEVDVARGTRLLARVCGAATRLPPAGRGRIDVDIVADTQGETWTRHVAGHAMRSRLRAHDGRLRETLGLVTFDFRIGCDDGRLHWTVERVRVFGVVLPRTWFRDVAAVEYEEDGRYRFDVRAGLPLAGLLVHYRGWLDVD